MGRQHDNLGPGKRLGRFVISKRLGTGATGTVYLCDDTKLSSVVAIKVLRPELNETDMVERYERELTLSRRIVHPGVSRVFDIHEEEGLRFLTMEYVPGKTLEAILEQRGVLPLTETVDIMRGVCRALQAAHAVGVLHRDLKPSNLMLGNNWVPSILDFGFAFAADLAPLTANHAVVGTANYVAPELFDGGKASPQSDLYAMGVILYRCLTGRYPFPGQSFMEIIEAAKTRAPTPPSHFNADVPQQFDALVLKLLSADPSSRPSSAQELDLAFGAVVEQSEGEHESSANLEPWNRDIERTTEMVAGLSDLSQLLAKQSQEICILFSDIVAVTAFFEQYGDVAGRKRILFHNRVLFPEIHDSHGTVIKTIGDAIMASFICTDDGVRAAIHMQRALAEQNQLNAGRMLPIEIRIGLHTGQAIVEKRDVFGDTVNTAARICAKALAGEILFEDTVAKKVTIPGLDISHRLTTAVKGKDAPLVLCEVQWRTDGSDEDTRPGGALGFECPPPVEIAAAQPTPPGSSGNLWGPDTKLDLQVPAEPIREVEPEPRPAEPATEERPVVLVPGPPPPAPAGAQVPAPARPKTQPPPLPKRAPAVEPAPPPIPEAQAVVDSILRPVPRAALNAELAAADSPIAVGKLIGAALLEWFSRVMFLTLGERTAEIVAMKGIEPARRLVAREALPELIAGIAAGPSLCQPDRIEPRVDELCDIFGIEPRGSCYLAPISLAGGHTLILYADGQNLPAPPNEVEALLLLAMMKLDAS